MLQCKCGIAHLIYGLDNERLEGSVVRQPQPRPQSVVRYGVERGRGGGDEGELAQLSELGVVELDVIISVCEVVLAGPVREELERSEVCGRALVAAGELERRQAGIPH